VLRRRRCRDGGDRETPDDEGENGFLGHGETSALSRIIVFLSPRPRPVKTGRRPHSHDQNRANAKREGGARNGAAPPANCASEETWASWAAYIEESRTSALLSPGRFARMTG
jgi:hypothetical protein